MEFVACLAVPLRYDHLRLLYPPRAESAARPAEVDTYRGFIAQYKYDDIRTLVYILPDRAVALYNRHRRTHLEYAMTIGMKKSILELNLLHGFYHVLDGGILRSLAKHGLDRIVLWDVLVHKSSYLVGTTYAERYELLETIAGRSRELETDTGRGLAYRINEHLWLAPSFRGNFSRHYAEIKDVDSVEGLVLKNPHGTLQQAFHEKNNTGWQVKIRKPALNYPF